MRGVWGGVGCETRSRYFNRGYHDPELLIINNNNIYLTAIGLSPGGSETCTFRSNFLHLFVIVHFTANSM